MSPEDLIKFSPQIINSVNSLNQMYNLLEELTLAVKSLYTDIACKSGCDTCCTGGNLAAVSFLEWSNIHKFINNNLNNDKIKIIIKNNNEIIQNYYEDLVLLHNNLTPETTIEKEKNRISYIVNKILPKFEKYKCPFLFEKQCLVYNDRPAKCRAHGFFAIMLGKDEIYLHTCDEEKKRWEIRFNNQQKRNVRLPLWNHVYSKIINLPNNTFSTLLPIWIYFNIKCI